VLLCFFAAAVAREPDVEPLPDAPLALVPFGVAEFVWHAPARGAVYAATQAVGTGVAIWGATERQAALDVEDLDTANTWQDVTGVAIATALVSYGVSVVDGSRIAEARARAAAAASARRQSVERFDAARAVARAGTP
jgi:secreted trypsin-like serine protease